jgi:hypothetical protein
MKLFISLKQAANVSQIDNKHALPHKGFVQFWIDSLFQYHVKGKGYL